MSLKRLLVVSGDALPLPGYPTTGAGLRAWGIGRGLESRGHEVVFSMPSMYVDGRASVPASIAENAWDIGGVMHVVRRVQPDVVVFCHWPSVQIPAKLNIPTVLDFHGPHLLEREIQGYSQRSTNIEEKIAAIRKADFFTCAGTRQRLYFLSWLLAAGIDVASDIIAAIPVSLSPDLPTHEADDGEPTFVYGGVFLPWQDPFNALDVTMETLATRNRGTLRFFGGRHPGYADQIGNLERFDDLETRLRKHPRVRLEGMVQHADLIAAYRRADVALDVMGRNPERELAFTTRTVEYLWCGLPVIYHDYAELSDHIRAYDAGWVVDPDNAPAIRCTVEQVLDEPDEIVRRGQNAQRLVRERLTWDRTIEPLDAFCRSPWQREPLDLPLPAPGQAQGLHLHPSVSAAPGKGWRSLLREARYHYRHGGLRRLAYYALGFVQKRLNQAGEYWP
jgi:glycosyltransferase involved in cell wall biosynthesis